MDTISYASGFVSQLSTWIGVIIGIIATVLVFRSSGKMGGGLFGSVLNLFGLGMVMMILGTLSVIFSNWIPVAYLEISRMVVFSTGYVLMVLGAQRLLKGIMS
jgi:hypothetical protein